MAEEPLDPGIVKTLNTLLEGQTTQGNRLASMQSDVKNVGADVKDVRRIATENCKSIEDLTKEIQQLRVVMYGNGDIGFGERLRALEKDVERHHEPEKGENNPDKDYISFRYLADKALPWLFALAIVILQYVLSQIGVIP